MGEKVKTLDSIKTLYTIGWGHLIKQNEEIKYSSTYTMEKSEGDALFIQDLKPIVTAVNAVFDNLYQWEFDALTSFIFNTCNWGTFF